MAKGRLARRMTPRWLDGIWPYRWSWGWLSSVALWNWLGWDRPTPLNSFQFLLILTQMVLILKGMKLGIVQCRNLLEILRVRFQKNMSRHKGLEWAEISARLEDEPQKLWSLSEMERTGGEPDVVGHDRTTNEYVIFDCSRETPKGRTSVCYDREALESRKEAKPANSAIEMAATMGIELLTEEQYLELQALGDFDTKTSSWVKTPVEIRRLGGALFGDRRYGRVFIYQNSAPCYYRVRGFRGCLKV